LRHALAAGAIALMIAGVPAIATAHPYQKTAVQVVSPDVAAWTSHLVIDTGTAHRDGIGRFAGGILARTSHIVQALTKDALRFLGTPYVFGGTSPSGFDCSGYVQHVFAMLGIHLPRTADAQYDAGRPAVGGLRAGDLVFFQTYTDGVSHVGIYLGDGKFVNASSSQGVVVSSLSEPYWASHYIGARRYFRANHLVAAR
jgi:cell wall-associated NlpC family hydrolase